MSTTETALSLSKLLTQKFFCSLQLIYCLWAILHCGQFQSLAMAAKMSYATFLYIFEETPPFYTIVEVAVAYKLDI